MRKNGMLKYINEHDKDDTYCRIIDYLLRNRQVITNLSVSKLAELTFVSPSTVTRFSKHFGYRSFQEMIYSLSDELTPSANFTYRLSKSDFDVLKENPKKFLEIYGNEVIDAIKDSIENISINEADILLQKIYSNNQIYLYGYSSAVDVAKSFQSGMLLNGKLVYLGNDEEQQEAFARSMNEKSLAIIFSSFGGFFSQNNAVWKEILKSGAQTVLITQSTNIRNSTEIDYLINIASVADIKRGNYSLIFFTEYLMSRYVQLFGS
ncbi:hypothetical protein BAU15_15030 [Enterococcus sp. JM4C]|uniref:MurR/RpiR family transcriptional regulator n=1 Tax=Candidatus Enterococcus huntleyi TaxID=1857217 RepID=UPI00137B0DDE|nr:MurR/RpiR family transcriptional regulator [Enterococcus sp. JM4C]KAF1296289.1 hypothetical protein BAU15_15030 [Enterococcus sp. JM4C]